MIGYLSQFSGRRFNWTGGVRRRLSNDQLALLVAKILDFGHPAQL
jgi:hypothetical protein